IQLLRFPRTLCGVASIALAIQHQQRHWAFGDALPRRFAFPALSLRRLAGEKRLEILAGAHAMAQLELVRRDERAVVEVSLQQLPRVLERRLGRTALLAVAFGLLRERRQQAAGGEDDELRDALRLGDRKVERDAAGLRMTDERGALDLQRVHEHG